VDPNEIRRQALTEFRRVLAELRKDARQAGTATLTSRELDREIAGEAEMIRVVLDDRFLRVPRTRLNELH